MSFLFRAMNILMPIAGLGSRFTKVGINTPKPLIEILGKPMVKWATDSLPFARPEDLIFVVRKEHVAEFKIDEKLREIYSDKIRVIVIDYVTEGAACTALLAKKYIDNDEPLIITDCDHYFVNSRYNKLAQRPEGIDGMIPVFVAEGDKWSFAKPDGNWFATEVAEKVRISNYANIGAYFFSRGKDFVRAAEFAVANNMRIKNEFYIAPLYNILINEGKKIFVAVCEECHGLGTPEDVEAFLKLKG